MDGKSIMGILSLNLAIPLHVEVISNAEISDIIFGNLVKKKTKRKNSSKNQ